jgi:hypothetical protein
MYIQTTIEGSEADIKGIKNKMKILQIDSLDFTSNASYCDFLWYSNPSDSLFIKVEGVNGGVNELHLLKRELE